MAIDEGGNYELRGYDAFNRLVSVQTQNNVVGYTYGADGLRRSKTVDGVETVHIWDGQNMVLELNGDGGVKDSYVRGLKLIKSSCGYYTYNAHGDVVGLVDETGLLTRSYSYDAFGTERDIDSEDINPFRYCGEYFDISSGTYYLRARYYSPAIGRFSSEDPIRDGLNWYTYSSNNPIRFIDPWGLANYQVGGLSLSPIFVHDAGFPYDPTTVATDADYKSWNEWGRNAFLAGLVPWLRDASKMYKHYRDNTGTDIKIDYGRAYKDDKTIKSGIDNEVSLMKDFVNSTYKNGGKTSFEIIGDLQGIANGTSENWQKTIGAHYVYGHGVVTIDTKTGMAKVVVTFYMEDMYNFNPGQADIASGTPDAVNGRFAELGWAKEFKTYGSLTQTITWQITAPSSTPNSPSKEGGR